MKRSSLILVILAACCVLQIASSAISEEAKTESATTSDQQHIVAEVNDVKISQEELNFALSKQLGPAIQQFNEDQKHALKKQMLEKMINVELLYSKAVEYKTTPTDEEVNAFVANVTAKVGGEDNFNKMLQKNGIDKETFLPGIKRDLAIKKYIEKNVVDSSEPSDEQLKDEFTRSPEKYSKPVEVHARHILFKLDQDADEKTTKEVTKKAEDVLAKAKASDADFAKLAKEHSEGPSKSKGGDLGYFTKNMMVPPFAEAAFKLEPGKVSELVRTRFGLHIIKVEGKRGGEKPKFEDVKENIKDSYLARRNHNDLIAHLKELRESSKVIVYIK